MNSDLKQYIMKRFVVILFFIIFFMIASNILILYILSDAGNNRIGITIIFDYQKINNTYPLKWLIMYIISVAVVVCIFTRLFSRLVSRRITYPVDKITEGLRQASSGKFDTKLDFETENEFVDIRDAFNYMIVEMKKSKELEQKYEKERSLLFSNIAHDLKTPITTIKGFSEAIVKGIVNSREQELEYLKVIAKKSDNMNQLIDLLFEYAKLENSENNLNIDKVDIAELLRECVSIMFMEFEEKNMSMKIDIPDEKIVINADEIQMKRGINNLLTNVIKHNPEGIEVCVKLEKDNKIVIADTGTCIPENIRNDIFKPFICGDEARTSKGGSGLGLAIAAKIMQYHKGNIELDCNYPNYTKAFIICLKK